jgi:hypothetical protein
LLAVPASAGETASKLAGYTNVTVILLTSAVRIRRT